MKIKKLLKQFQEQVIYLLNNKRISIRNKIFFIVGLFIILNIIINLFIVKVSINQIYLGLEKKELKKEYSLIKKNINNKEELLNIIYNASDDGIKIKILDSNLNVIYSIFTDRLDGRFTDLDLMLLNSLDNSNSKIITLENNRKNGYNLYLVGKLDNNYIIISSSIESLKNDAKTALVIILITSIITLFILSIIAYYISKLLSEKINELKDVTSDISNLKFDRKISINTNDELGDLFNNINKMSDNLEENISKLELVNERLQCDLNEKEKQESLRKQLIANISHEFKTPLTIISGYSQLVKEETKDKESKENLDKIIKETEKLSELVYDFLELSKLESGKLILNLETLDFKDLVDDELNKLMQDINKNGINLNLKYDIDNNVLVDKKQISRVIENILTNAIKFCDGKKNINIKTYNNDGYFYFEVFNTGEKIKDADLENIFSSYYKEKTGRNKKGTGLGLTIVKTIVDLHDGDCIVTNQKDGVKFTIKLKRS